MTNTRRHPAVGNCASWGPSGSRAATTNGDRVRRTTAGLTILAAVLAGITASTAHARLAARSGTVTVRISGPSDDQTFSAKLNGRPIPESIAQAARRFGRPMHKHRIGPSGVECEMSWPREHISGMFTVANSGARDGCEPGAATIKLTLGTGWTTSRGLGVGASAARLRQLYPDASEHGNSWALIQYFYGAGFEVTELGAATKRGAVADLTVAGIPDE